MGKRIGIMGGTFDPIHIGHLVIAEYAYEQFQLEEVMFMPSANPPHKFSIHTNQEQRKEMIMCGIEDNPHFSLSLIEYERKGMTYTVDTLCELSSLYPHNKYFFIIGADSFYQLEKWHKPEVLFQYAHFLVATRNGQTYDIMEEHKKKLEKKYGAKINFLYVPALEISSSEIRRRIGEGKSTTYFLTEKVMKYIEDNGLYLKD